MREASKRLVGVDVLRALAVLGVLAAHLCAISLFIGTPGLLRPASGVLEQALWRLASVGGDGVLLFFAISGFVITSTILERDGDLARMRIGAFYRRRIARIWPALILSLALGTVALLTAARTSPAAHIVIFGDAPFTAAFWLSIASFTLNFARFAISPLDWGYHWNVLWSLSVEEQFYLFFPILMRFAVSREQRLTALLACLAIGAGSRWAVAGIPGAGLLLTPNCLDPLALGVAAALLPRFRISRDWSVRGAALGLALLIAAAVSGLRVAAPALIALAAGLVMLCCRDGAVFTHGFWRPLARVGRVSYGMYLFHPLVLWGLMPILHGMAFLPALTLFVAATVVVAEISFAAIERPIGRWILNGLVSAATARARSAYHAKT